MREYCQIGFMSFECRSSSEDSKVRTTQHLKGLIKWYYEKKNTFIFFSDFETMFTKHSSSEILNLNFEKMTVYFTVIFRFNGPPLLQ